MISSPSDAPGSDPPAAPQRPVARWAVPVAVVAVLGIVGVVAVLLFRPESLPAGVSAREYDSAEAAFEQTFGRRAGRMDTLMLLAELAVREDRLQIAAACFDQVATTNERYGASARFQQAQVLLRLNRVTRAEQNFKAFLELGDTDPSIPADQLLTARKWLTFIFAVELRFEDRQRVLREVHQRGQADVFDSEQYFFPTLLMWNSTLGRARLRQYLKADPDNPVLLTAQGRYLLGEGHLIRAEQLLTSLRRRFPRDLSCAAVLLRCYYEQVNWNRIATLLRELPAWHNDEPWLLTEMRGEFALHEQRWQAAVKQFQRLLRHDPANPVCHMGLAKAYAGLGRHRKREAVQERSLLLSKIRVDLSGINSDSLDVIRSVAESCRQLGFTEAAAVFDQHAITAEENAP